MKAKKIYLIKNSKNVGISVASNQAVDLIKSKIKSDIILKLDNDAFCLNTGWLEAMIKIFKSNRLIALSTYISGLLNNPGGAPRIGYGNICGHLIGMTKHIGGICHFVGSKGYDGWKWPENEQLHGMQDVEFSQYLISKGYQMGYLESFSISHGVNGTSGQQETYKDYFERRKIEKQTRYEKN